MSRLPPTTVTDVQRDWRRLVLRWLISSLAIFAAIALVPGIEFSGPGWQIGVVALVFGLLNALIRPLLLLLTCPIVLLTLGMFTLVINAVLLGLTSALADSLGIAFHVTDFGAAFLGGVVISVVSTALNYLAGDAPITVIKIERKD